MTICRTIKDQFGSAISKSVVASTRSEMIADVRVDDKNVLTLKMCANMLCSMSNNPNIG